MKNIAQLTDIHIRFNSREHEYRKVFSETYKELKKQSPDRIVVTGDLFHTKINMSPVSTALGGEFLTNLSKIAPVDIILGNHDMNERVLEQGNTVEPIVNLLKNGKTLKKEESPVEYYQNGLYGIYLYKYSGYYTISDKIVYGVYSIWDKELLELKESNKKNSITYIALYHAPVYGCKMDNGMVNNSASLLNTSNFNNFDIVMLGDIHKYQNFNRKEGNLSMAYPGSLIQQSYGESLDKGYLLWNIEDRTHERVLIENEHGFCKLKIKNSKDLEAEVLKNIKFSKLPQKTKVYIEYEDREENYSLEKESNIINLIQEKFGCDSVGMSFITSTVTKKITKEEEEKIINLEFEEQLIQFLEDGNYDNKENVLELSDEIEKALDLKYSENFKWSLNKLEIQNLFSMPDKLLTFDFDKIQGITGILGENFSGKTNIIRSLVWVIWGEILGNGDSKDSINIYSKSNTAHGTCYITINEILFKIHRAITKKVNKSTKKIACSHVIEFDFFDNGVWKPVISEEKSTGKVEIKNLINTYFGTYEDFTKVSLQVQNGEGDYLSLDQQPKNKLFSRYLNLLHFNDRYNEANETFKLLKRSQKTLGNPLEIEKVIKELTNSKKEHYENLEVSKNLYKQEQEKIKELNLKIRNLESSKKDVTNSKYSNIHQIEQKIKEYNQQIQSLEEDNKKIEIWLDSNFKKSIDDYIINMDIEEIKNSIQQIKERLFQKKSNFDTIKNWIEQNVEKDELNDSEYLKKLADSKGDLKETRNKLQIAKGENCPTCGSVLKESDESAKQELENKINNITKDITNYELLLEESNKIKEHNKNYSTAKEKFSDLKLFLLNEKSKLEKLVEQVSIFNSSKEFIEINKSIDEKNLKLKTNRTKLENYKNEAFSLKQEILEFNSNIEKIEHNTKINSKINILENELNLCSMHLEDSQYEIDSFNKEIILIDSKISNEQDNLEKIKKAEQEYKKYSVYLQAVHRDGIPMKIIKNKLPVINNRINNIIKGIVNFKIELYITIKGDIKERFYFGEKRENSLPLSMSSGSQYFISVLAIRDALHSVSHLTKPNLCVIDEGFGSLDDEKTIEIKGILEYLKSKYKNLIIITHRNEIKDFFDYEIYISRKELGEDAWHSEISI